MSKDCLRAFWQKLETDEQFRNEVRSDPALKANSPSALTRLAKQYGFSFTAREREALVAELRKAPGKPKLADLVSSADVVGMCDTLSASSCSRGNPSNAR